MRKVLLVSMILALCCILIGGSSAICSTSSAGQANIEPVPSKGSLTPSGPVIYLGDRKVAAKQPDVGQLLTVKSQNLNVFDDDPELAQALKSAGITSQEQWERLSMPHKSRFNHSLVPLPIILTDTSEVEPNNTCDRAQPVNMGDRIVCGHISWEWGNLDVTDYYVFTLDNTYPQWVLACSTYAPTDCTPAMSDLQLLLYNSDCSNIVDFSGTWGNQQKLSSILLPGTYKIRVSRGAIRSTGYYNLQFAAGQYVPPGTPISELEPNDDCFGAWGNQILAGQYVACGELTTASDSVDYFAITLDGSQPWWTLDLWTTPPSCSPEIYDTQLSLYNSDCSQLLGYSDDGGQHYYSAFTAYSLPPGDYIVKAAATVHSLPSGHYDLFFAAAAGNPPPVNDNCADVTPVPLILDSVYTFAGDNTGATRDCPLLAADPGGEVWEAFTIDQTMDVTIDYCGVELYTLYSVLAQGCPCGSLISASGWDYSSCSDGMPTIWWANLPAGTYYIPIYSFTGVQGPYAIHVKGVLPPPPPPNDNCVDVIPEFLQSGASLTFTGNSRGSTPDCDLIVDELGNPLPESWIAFAIQESLKVIIDFCATSPSLSGYFSAAVWDCPCSAPIITDDWDHYGCPSGELNPIIRWNLTPLPPGTYYYPIIIEPGGGQEYVINVTGKRLPPVDFQVTAPGSWPGNTHGAGDDCSNVDGFEDQVWEVTIPNNGIWTFSTCNSIPPNGQVAYMTVGTEICIQDIYADWGTCPPGFLPHYTIPIAAGTYFMTLEGAPGLDTSDYQLDVYREPTPTFSVTPTEVQGQAERGEADSVLLTVSNPDDGALVVDMVLATENLLRSHIPPVADRLGEQIWESPIEEKSSDPKAPAPPPNRSIILQGGDNIGSATIIPTLPYHDEGTTEGYTDDYTEGCPYPSVNSPDVVYSYTAAADGYIDINLCNGTGFGSMLYVYENSYTPGSPYACIRYSSCPSRSARLQSMYVTGGNTYYIVIDGWDDTNYGSYVIDVSETGPPPGCFDADVLFGQDPSLPTHGFYGYAISDMELYYGMSVQRFENFVGAFGSITEVKFYGFNLDGQWAPCTQGDSTFHIVFLRDNAGAPGDTVAIFDAPATMTPTGWIYASYLPITLDLQEYHVILPEPVSNLNHGWISIAGGGAVDGCYFAWITSPYGDGMSYDNYDGIYSPNPDLEYPLCLIGTPAEPWLTIDGQTRERLEIGPYGSAQVNVRMNAANLPAGSYAGDILFRTNDPFRPTADVPVGFTVTAPSGCAYIPGDINGNGVANGIDVIYGVGFFKGGPVPLVDCFPVCPTLPNPFYGAGDVNGSCLFNGIDITYFVAYLKGSQPALNSCPVCPPVGGLAAPAVVKPALRSSGGQVTGGSE